MRSEGFSFYTGGLVVARCSRDPAFGVRNRPKPFAHDRREGKVYGGSHKNVSTCQKMCSCRFAWQVWLFVTFDVF